MRSYITYLLLASTALVVCVSGYDAGAEVVNRAEHVKAQCKKYLDPRRPEYDALIKETSTKNKHFRIFPKDETKDVLSVCVPLKVGQSSWANFNLKMYNTLGNDIGMGTLNERSIKNKKYDTLKNKRAIQVRHPLERLLSSYIFSFIDSTTHRDMTKRLKENWLNKRADKLTPREGEKDTDSSNKHQTLTFRQFTSMLTRCPSEYPECQVLVNDGLGHHWYPYWSWCSPCAEGYQPDYVIDMHHLEEDKNFLFNEMGLNAEIEFPKENPTKNGNASDEETQKKYFGQLTKQEIYELYLKYKLDHDLFGYSPEKFIAFGREE